MRVLVDTNVWRYASDADASARLLASVRRRGNQIVVAPSVAYESLRIPNDDTRLRVMGLVTHRAWKRLMPEAYSECQELLQEIRRLRPEWLRKRPNFSELRRLRYDWLRKDGGFWTRARTGPHKEFAAIKKLGDEDLELARTESYRIREKLAANELRAGEHTHLSQLYGVLPSDAVGWNGEPVEYWRLPALTNTQDVLQKYAHPYREWLDGEVDVTAMLSDLGSFNKFWLYEVTAINLPRFWLRAAFEFLQAWRRVTDGTPCDTQLATYLIEADVVVSGDKNFVHFTKRCRSEGPIRIAEAYLVAGGDRGVKELFEFLERDRPTC